MGQFRENWCYVHRVDWVAYGSQGRRRCPKCTTEGNSRRRKLHPEWNHNSLRNRRVRNRQTVRDYLREHPCVDCGESDIDVLQLDHVRGVKVERLSRLVNSNVSHQAILREIAKCEVRCANCHQRKSSIVVRRKYGLV